MLLSLSVTALLEVPSICCWSDSFVLQIHPFLSLYFSSSYPRTGKLVQFHRYKILTSLRSDIFFLVFNQMSFSAPLMFVTIFNQRPILASKSATRNETTFFVTRSDFSPRRWPHMDPSKMHFSFLSYGCFHNGTHTSSYWQSVKNSHKLPF